MRMISGERREGGGEISAPLLDSGLMSFAARNVATSAQVEQFLTSMRAQGFMDELDRLRKQVRHSW